MFPVAYTQYFVGKQYEQLFQQSLCFCCCINNQTILHVFNHTLNIKTFISHLFILILTRDLTAHLS